MGLSTYPNVLDTRAGNANLRAVIDFEDRLDTTAVLDYSLLAADIEFLQDAVIAIEAELGVNPSSTDPDVATRIATILTQATADLRYGGVNWVTNGAPTIQGHTHTSNKINLATDVTGLLPAANINLGAAGALTAQLIYLTDSFTTTIGEALNSKMDNTGGTITGDLVVEGSFKNIAMVDLDAYTEIDAVGTSVSDSTAYSGSAAKATVTDASGVFISYTQEMRFFDYSVSIRCKVSDVTQTDSICDIKILSGATEARSYTLTPDIFDANNTYKILHFPFTHSDASKNVTVRIDWFGSGRQGGTVTCDLVVDSIIISPINNAAYWKLV